MQVAVKGEELVMMCVVDDSTEMITSLIAYVCFSFCYKRVAEKERD